MENRKTLVIGASENPERYSFLAVSSLRNHGHDVVALGLKPGKIADVDILTEKSGIEGIDTVSLYVGQKNQPAYYHFLEQLKPRRVIFNPGTENPDFENQLRNTGTEVQEACTLVLLSTGQY